MDELLNAITALVSLVSPEKVQAVATRVRRTEASKARVMLSNVVGTPVASTAVEQLVAAWQNCSGLIIPDTILGGTVATKIRGVQ